MKIIAGLKTATLASVLFIVACNSKTTESTKPSLKGAWQISKATGAMPERQVGNTYLFTDTSLSITEFGIVFNGSLMQADTSFVWNNLGKIKTYSYNMDGSQLVIHPMESDQQFYLEKK